MDTQIIRISGNKKINIDGNIVKVIRVGAIVLGTGGDVLLPATRTMQIDQDLVYVGTPDGSISKPFRTIQAALDTVATATTKAELAASGNHFLIIAPTTTKYIEDLVAPLTANIVLFMPAGVVIESTNPGTIPVITQDWTGTDLMGWSSPDQTSVSLQFIGAGTHNGTQASALIGDILVIGAGAPQAGYFNIKRFGVHVEGDIETRNGYTPFQMAAHRGSTLNGNWVGTYAQVVQASNDFNVTRMNGGLGLGGATGNVAFTKLDNVTFTKDAVVNTGYNSSWRNVAFQDGDDALPAIAMSFSNPNDYTWLDVDSVTLFFLKQVTATMPPSENLRNVDVGFKVRDIATGNATLEKFDAGGQIKFRDPTAAILNVPLHVADIAVDLPIDSAVNILRLGAGTVTISILAGANINGVAGPTTVAITDQWKGATLQQDSANNWVLYGAV